MSRGMPAWLDFSSFFGGKKKFNKEAYGKYCFPYGDEQRTQVLALLRCAVARWDEPLCMCTYLSGRDAYHGGIGSDEELSERERFHDLREALTNLLPGRARQELPLYAALILADAAVDETLQYPDIAGLRAQAAALQARLDADG